MSDTTMLAHLAKRFGTGTENLATEALLYVLESARAGAALERHGRHFCSELPHLQTYRSQAFAADDAAIPDLVGDAPDGSTPLIVEAKFGAALTSNQPVTYLQRLRALDSPALLLFLVPHKRQSAIWSEVRRRCGEEGLELADGASAFSGVTGQVVVGVTTWGSVLDDIEASLQPRSDHAQTLAEVEQLRGLCASEDRNLFRPFTAEFLAGNTGTQILALDSLVTEVVNGLVADRSASKRGLTWSSGQGYFGRYLKLAGWECYLHVNFRRWGEPHSPLWLRVTDKRAAAHSQLRDALRPLELQNPPRLLDPEGRRQIPIFVPADAERDEVFSQIDAQVREVCSLLRTSPPPDGLPQTETDLGEQ
ncbi:hypothetical protein BH10ACT1_BH10ACT1_34070 [soil metagenome]